MPERKRALVGSSYFDLSYFNQYNPDGQSAPAYLLNSILSTTLAMFEYFENLLFKNDPNRIVYAKNDYAFRARVQTQKGTENSELQLNTLNMPFLNFAMSDVSLSNTRLISPYAAKKEGIYIEEIGKKVRLVPITISYEGCFFSTQTADAHVVLSKLFKKNSLQTILQPKLYYDDKEFANFGELTYSDIKLDDQYAESDWLEQNRIHTVAFSIDVNTFMVDTDPGIDADSENNSYCIPKELILNWGIRNNLSNWDGYPEDDYDGQVKFTIDHVNQEVYPKVN